MNIIGGYRVPKLGLSGGISLKCAVITTGGRLFTVRILELILDHNSWAFDRINLKRLHKGYYLESPAFGQLESTSEVV